MSISYEEYCENLDARIAADKKRSIDGGYVSHLEQTLAQDRMDVPKFCAINKPEHYAAGAVECIAAIESALTDEEFIGYLKGQIMKYNWRLGKKDLPLQDAGKLLWYAERLRKTLASEK